MIAKTMRNARPSNKSMQPAVCDFHSIKRGSAAADLNSYIAVLAFFAITLFITYEASASITVLAGDEHYEPLYIDGPLVKNTYFAQLPDDPDASCNHSNIEVKFNISPQGSVFGVRLKNPTKDYLYLAAIVRVMSYWEFKPTLKDGLADTVRGIIYEFSMKDDFVPCLHNK